MAVRDADPEDGGLSLFEVGAVLLRSRRLILLLVALGGLTGFLVSTVPQSTYTASTSFVSQGSQDVGQGGFRNIAIQFGVSLAGATQTQLPQFYADLLQSRVILGPMLFDTLVVAEQGGARRVVADILGVTGLEADRRAEEGFSSLASLVSTRITPKTGVLTVQVRSPWRSVSQQLAERVLYRINLFNSRTRQVQASVERRFTEARLAEARVSLRAAEDRMQAFLQSNRLVSGSPQLAFELDRLRADVTLQNQVVSSLATTLEDVRIREIRDTPVITVLEPPTVATRPDPRRRVMRTGLGVLTGAVLAILFALARDSFRRHQSEGGAGAEEFFQELARLRVRSSARGADRQTTDG